MDKEPHSPELATPAQISELVDLAGQAINSPHADTGFAGSDRVWISASLEPFDDTGRLGVLVLDLQPTKTEQSSFLSVRYMENGLGEDRKETEVLYMFSRDANGNLAMHVSDEVSEETSSQLLHKAAEDEDESMSEELYTAFNVEALDLLASLKPASVQDYVTLKALLECALNGNEQESKWDREIRLAEAALQQEIALEQSPRKSIVARFMQRLLRRNR